MKVSVIAAMAKNRVIGQDNKMPWHLPEDLKFFKQTTMDTAIVMGRKTFESFGLKPLPGRLNIVVSSQPLFSTYDNVFVCSNLDTAVETAKRFACEKNRDEIFVIGGGQIYQQAIEFADEMLLTVIDREFPGDAYFPEFDRSKWQVSSRESLVSEKDPSLHYCIQRWVHHQNY